MSYAYYLSGTSVTTEVGDIVGIPEDTSFVRWCTNGDTNFFDWDGQTCVATYTYDAEEEGAFTIEQDVNLYAYYKWNTPELTATAGTDKNTDDGAISGLTGDYEYVIIPSSATDCQDVDWTSAVIGEVGGISTFSSLGANVCLRRLPVLGIEVSEPQFVVIEPATTTEVVDEDTGIVVDDPEKSIPATECISIVQISAGTSWTSFAVQIPNDELYKMWDIKIVNCTSGEVDFEPDHSLTVTIPNALKDAVTDYNIYHQHFTNHNPATPESVQPILNHRRSSSNPTTLVFETTRFSLFAVSYAVPEVEDGSGDEGAGTSANSSSLSPTGANAFWTLWLLLVTLLVGAGIRLRKSNR